MENSQQLTPLCAYNKQVYHVCINPKCTQVCFICDQKCQCKVLHQQCNKVDWIYITKKLNRGLIKNTPEFKSFSDKLDQLYQNSIKDITKAYDDFKTWRDNFGLTEYQSSFLHLIEEGRFTELTSAKMYELTKEIRKPSKIILKSENQFNEEAESINTKTGKMIEQLKGLYAQNKVIKDNQDNDTKINVLRIGKIIDKFHVNSSRFQEMSILNPEKVLFIESKINGLSKQIQNYYTNQILAQALDYYKKIFQQIDNKFKKLIKYYNQQKLSTDKLEQELVEIESEMQQAENQVLLKIEKIKEQSIFNFPKKIKAYNLLYRASQNNFQVSKFWEVCNGKTNTITILKTQFGKIIGGYTPLAWNQSIGDYQQDNSKQTFLFSITQKHKLPISGNQGYATYHHPSYGPTFGRGHDLCICDKANVTESSEGNIVNTYNNGEYNINQQGYKKWSGQSKGHKFLIQQWEVYKIIFE